MVPLEKNLHLRMGRPMGMPSGPSHGMKGGGKHEEILGEFFGVVKSFNPDKGWLRHKDPHGWGKTEHPWNNQGIKLQFDGNTNRMQACIDQPMKWILNVFLPLHVGIVFRSLFLMYQLKMK